MSITIFNFESFQVRFVGTPDRPEWVAADVCAVLDYANSRQAVEKLDEDEKGVCLVDTPGGMQQMTTVFESGLYSLILASRKPQAKAFKRWITGEVLPSIRKTGSYSTQSLSPEVQLRLPHDYLSALRSLVAAEEEKLLLQSTNAELESKVSELQPKAEVFDIVINSGTNLTMGEVAKLIGVKGLGRNKLFEFLRSEHILDSTNMPYQQFLDRAYFGVVQKPRFNNVLLTDPVYLVTQKGLQFIINKLRGAGYEIPKAA